jgi:lipopolysaccharide cholinephosphotransferase
MNRKLAISNLKAVKDCFDEFGIDFWLNLGTLLGATRDGKIIDWDADIDLCMWSHDSEKLILALHELKRRKFKFTVDQPLSRIADWLQ